MGILEKRSAYISSISCNRAHISSSLRGQAPCQPRDKVIAIHWPNNTDVHQLTPTHVTVRRCSGGCHQDHQSCVTSLTRTREVPVILGKCPVSGGKCEKECTSVEVEDEVECECGCRRKESECGEKHEWMSDTCECECKDSVGRTECLEGGPGRVWDSAQCECVCPVTLSCQTGMEYHQATCSCQPSIPVQDILFVQREERSDPVTVICWEYIVIFVLGCLLITFLLIILTLLWKIYVLKNTLKSAPNLIPTDISENLYSQTPNYKSDVIQPFITSKPEHEKANLQLFSSSSDMSSPYQCCSDIHTDSSFYSDSSDGNPTSVHRHTPTHNPTPHYQPYQYKNLNILQEEAASECCSLMGKETHI